MAHRLLLRRICTVGVKDVRGLSASTTRAASSCFSTAVQSAAPRVSFLSASRTLPRSLPHTSRRQVSFNVQDQEDFTERVINSQLPVLIDFHAQWVLGEGNRWLVGILCWATVGSNQGVITQVALFISQGLWFLRWEMLCCCSSADLRGNDFTLTDLST